jgi:transcriptional regulator with XRE-family HTH domain
LSGVAQCDIVGAGTALLEAARDTEVGRQMAQATDNGRETSRGSGSSSFGDFLIERRERLGMNQTMLADAAGISKSAINAMEHGRVRLPGPERRRAIAAALKVRHVDLLVAAGELDPDEVRGEVPEIETDTPQGKLAEVAWHLTKRQAESLLNLISAWGTARGRLDRALKAAPAETEDASV